jgi:hypothetical protein
MINPDGNVQHIAEHGLTMEDVEYEEDHCQTHSP